MEKCLTELDNKREGIMIKECSKLYGLKNAETGKLILLYGTSCSRNKALFAELKMAQEAARIASEFTGCEIMIVEYK